MPDGAQVDNPFQIPRMTPDPCQPLRPWEVPAHLDYYVPVDKTEAAFSEFQRQTRSPESLVAHGRLVVVVGGQGCGKTSLINRCTASIHETLVNIGVTPVIADLTTEGMSNQTIPDRMRHVCTILIDQLTLEQRLDNNTLDELTGRIDSPERVYPLLSRALKRHADAGDNLAVVVLLPPSDLVSEIIKYAGLVRPRLLFFAESSYLEAHSGWQSRLPPAPAPPIALAVGILETRDGYVFSEERLRHHGDGRMPRVSEKTMNKLQDYKPSLTIGQLQRLLFGVYEDLLGRDTPVTEVTLEHITEYFFRHGTS